MGIFDRLETRLARGVNNAFARVFRSEVQPVEIASAIRRTMDDHATRPVRGAVSGVPTEFTIRLSGTDFGRLTAVESQLSKELIANAAEHIETQRYAARGRIAVYLEQSDALATGVFNISTNLTNDSTSFGLPRSKKSGGSVNSPVRPVSGVKAILPGFAKPNPNSEPKEQGARTPSVPSSGSNTPASAAPVSRENLAASAAPTAESVSGSAPPPPKSSPSPAVSRLSRPQHWLEIDGRVYPLTGAMTTIGREHDADITLQDGGISRYHTEIRITNDGKHTVFTVRDLNSTNGTFVNQQPITSVRVEPGVRIMIGRTTMTLHSRK